jgi:glycosyltransferase involved in cell wall biosynthesis
MTFCMLTTFFGPHSFGGDAAFVDRLSRALARRGHDVHVIYCRDAFEMSRGEQTPRPYEPPPGVTIHALSSPMGPLSPLATHQTGAPWFKLRAIRRILRDVRPQVVHFHNLSLIGGPSLLKIQVPDAVKLMTAHEHWLVCPQHVLWKTGEGLCQARDCVRCCLKAGRPPQLWRSSGLLEDSLTHLDALFAPSKSTVAEHARRGLQRPMLHLPYFLPDDYAGTAPAATTPDHVRPYVVAAGRLEEIKGFQEAIDAMRGLPDVDLRIAGTGAFEASLRARAAGMSNIHFEGRLDSTQLAALFRGARALVVPSLVYETFGYVVLEAFAERTPVIVRDLGALPELVASSGAGFVFDSVAGIADAIRRLADPTLRARLGESGHRAWKRHWSEDDHLDAYFSLIEDCQRARQWGIEAPQLEETREAHRAAAQPA